MTDDRNEPLKPKKATNRDVAKLAGVSVATVSYVVNGREDQHISEATKKKVYQAINFLNYSPNPYAVGLNSEQPQTVVIRSSASASSLTEREILNFMHTLDPLCEKKNMQLNYSLDKRAAKLAATACICFDMPNEEFHDLAGENFIPVIAVDSLVNDPVFFQITVDFDNMLSAARTRFGEDFCYVCIEPSNAQTKRVISDTFANVAFLSKASDADKVQCKRIVLSQPSLLELFENKDFEIFFYTANAEKRPSLTMECINKALNRLNVADEEHFVKL